MAGRPIASCRLYGFIDTAYLAGRDPADLARQLIDGGVDVIQVRAKQATPIERRQLGETVLEVATARGVPLIVNDDIDTATGIGADGVHLGQEDWAAIPPAERVDRLAGVSIVGLSTHSLDQARSAQRDGADYIGVGPVFPTATKQGVAAVGLDLVRAVSRAPEMTVPFFAIGGITVENVDRVLAAGATRVAVVSAILTADDVTSAAAVFKERIS